MVYIETFKRQFLSIFNNTGLMILLFVGPIFLILFVGGVYLNDYVEDISIAILDEDNSSLSNKMVDYFVTAERFDVVSYETSREVLQQKIDDGQVQVGLFIPKGMEKEATTFQSTEILLIVDGTNLVVANNAYAQATTIITTLSAGVEMRLLQGKGLTPDMTESIAKVINISERMLYDSKMTYMNYLIVCFLAVFLQQLYLAGMGSMLVRNNDFLAHGKVHVKALGASSALVVGFVPATAICLLIFKYLFHVPMNGNMWIIALMTMLYLTILTGPALILAAFTKDRIAYSQFSLMLSLPTFVSSGCVWPVEQMPKAFEMVIRCLWPLINFAKPLQEMMIKGREVSTLRPEILQLVIYGLVVGAFGVVLYKKAYSNRVEKIELNGTFL